MAIPFHLPTPEQTEDSYRLIHQLLNDVCELLRQIVIGQRQLPVPPQPAPRSRNNGGRRAEMAEPRLGAEVLPAEAGTSSAPVLPLPDLVLSTLSSATTTSSLSTTRPITTNSTTVTTSSTSSICSEQQQEQNSLPPQRPPRRRRRITRVRAKNISEEPAARIEDWVKVGEDLRKIADDFRATLQEANKKPPSAEPTIKSQSSLLSFLLPAPLRGSLWTAVILLLGWRLFHPAV